MRAKLSFWLIFIVDGTAPEASGIAPGTGVLREADFGAAEGRRNQTTSLMAHLPKWFLIRFCKNWPGSGFRRFLENQNRSEIVLAGRDKPDKLSAGRAVSSVVEHYLDTGAKSPRFVGKFTHSPWRLPVCWPNCLSLFLILGASGWLGARYRAPQIERVWFHVLGAY